MSDYLRRNPETGQFEETTESGIVSSYFQRRYGLSLEEVESKMERMNNSFLAGVLL